MINVDPVPAVADDELLARFLVNKNEFRADKSIKPKAFLPFSYVELSVSRHRDSNEAELWEVGRQVAQLRNCTLYGRSYILAQDCRIDPLDVQAHPLSRPVHPVNNPNHANVIGYPAAKEDQMSLAQKLAAKAGKRVAPAGEV